MPRIKGRLLRLPPRACSLRLLLRLRVRARLPRFRLRGSFRRVSLLLRRLGMLLKAGLLGSCRLDILLRPKVIILRRVRVGSRDIRLRALVGIRRLDKLDIRRLDKLGIRRLDIILITILLRRRSRALRQCLIKKATLFPMVIAWAPKKEAVA